MSNSALYFSLSYDSAECVKSATLKTNYLSVRLIKDSGTVNPKKESYETNVLLNGKCIDPETRCLYVFYIDTYYGSAWIIEINLDTRVQNIVYYDKENNIGFDHNYKIYNASVSHGKLIWTDNKNPIYQMDIKRAKKSFYYQIGYDPFPDTAEWQTLSSYGENQIVSAGNYFYKSNIDGNIGIDPRTDDGTFWTKLCLIEDAYYSMKVENFYFEAMPPKYPPTVEYFLDDTRKINSLRQTLFQIAYRYVYMDWRKSTFSPASIVPVPQNEEESDTGLATEQVSLNNMLKIMVNTGGEEVRAVEIVGRSSSDPSTWYLIETINKFDEEERAGEVSPLKDVSRNNLTITIPEPEVTSAGIVLPDSYMALSLSVPAPTVLMTYVDASDKDMEWVAEEYGDSLSVRKTTVISVGGAAWYHATLASVPSWIKVIETAGGTELTVEGAHVITNGMEIALFPRTANTGASRGIDEVILEDNSPFNNQCTILVLHKRSLLIPTVGVYVHPEDGSDLTISGESGEATSGSAYIDVTFTPNLPSVGPLVDYMLNYLISKNGVDVGSGTIIVTNNTSGTHELTMSSAAAPAQSIQVLLWYGELES